MAVLNLKNFPDELYDELKSRAHADGRSVSAEVTYLLAEALVRRRPYTIDDLRGVGKEIWRGVDVEKFVDRERDSW